MTKKSPLPVGERMTFDAVLEDWAEGMNYCAVRVPQQITQALGTTGPVLVWAQVNDSAPFEVSLFPVGGGKHYIRIKARVRKETSTESGDMITVRFTVRDRSDVSLPDDLSAALRSEGVEKAFHSLPPGKQSFTIRQIEEAARPSTREKRIQKAVDLAHQRREQLADKK